MIAKTSFNKPNTDFMKKSFSYRSAVTWNKLPRDIVSEYQTLSTTRFKNLIDHYFQNLENSN